MDPVRRKRIFARDKASLSEPAQVHRLLLSFLSIYCDLSCRRRNEAYTFIWILIFILGLNFVNWKCFRTGKSLTRQVTTDVNPDMLPALGNRRPVHPGWRDSWIYGGDDEDGQKDRQWDTREWAWKSPTECMAQGGGVWVGGPARELSVPTDLVTVLGTLQGHFLSLPSSPLCRLPRTPQIHTPWVVQPAHRRAGHPEWAVVRHGLVQFHAWGQQSSLFGQSSTLEWNDIITPGLHLHVSPAMARVRRGSRVEIKLGTSQSWDGQRVQLHVALFRQARALTGRTVASPRLLKPNIHSVAKMW